VKTERKELARGLLVERVAFRGHPLVLALHPTTIEITTEGHLTRKGDCIVGVSAEKGCAGLSEEVKRALANSESSVVIRISVGGESFELKASGDPRLTLAHPHDMVIRKSDFVSERTLAVRADAAAKDIPREMVRMLKNPDSTGYLEVEVQPPD